MNFKDEQPFADALVEYLFPGEGCKAEKIAEDAGTPDFQVPSKKFVFEVKTIVDGERLGMSSRLHGAQENIRKALKQNAKYAKLPSVFLVTSNYITLSKGKIAARVADRLLDAMLAGEAEIRVDGYRFQIHKIDDQREPKVMFGAFGSAFNGSIKVLKPKIFERLAHANTRQLGTFKADHPDFSSAVLMVNQFQWGATKEEIIEALAMDTEALRAFTNVDAIWCVDLGPDGPLTPYKLFDKDVRSWLSASPTPPSSEFELFGHWLRALFETDTAKFFDLTKVILKNHKPEDVFPDIHVRVRILDFTKWLMKEGRHADAMWLTDRFSDDTSPQASDSNHESILNGETEIPSFSVRGQLAWSAHELCLSEVTLPAAYRHTIALMRESNLHVKNQALIPLLELMSRIKFLGAGEQEELKQITLQEALPLIQYAACKDRVVALLWYCRWLSSETAADLVRRYADDETIVPLLLMFAVGMDGGFDSSPFADRLKAILAGSAGTLESRSAAVGQVIRDLWDLEDHKDEAERAIGLLQSFVDVMVESPFDAEVHLNVNYALDSLVNIVPAKFIEWHLRFLDSIICQRRRGGSGYVYVSVAKTARALAEAAPARYVVLLEKIEQLASLQVHLGDVSETLELASGLGETEKAAARSVHRLAKVQMPRLASLSF